MKKWAAVGCVAVFMAVICQMIYGLWHWKRKSAMAVSVIGGADGPTSIFIAGKVSSGLYMGMALCSVVILLIAVIVFLIWRRKR